MFRHQNYTHARIAYFNMTTHFMLETGLRAVFRNGKANLVKGISVGDFSLNYRNIRRYSVFFGLLHLIAIRSLTLYNCTSPGSVSFSRSSVYWTNEQTFVSQFRRHTREDLKAIWLYWNKRWGSWVGIATGYDRPGFDYLQGQEVFCTRQRLYRFWGQPRLVFKEHGRLFI
jgi:hypothetical protein